MKMKKLLFLIHDLGHGGAEKVLVNLVNNMDSTQFDITIMALFGGGVNEQFLKPHIRLINIFPKAFPGNSHAMKLLSPKALHCWFIKEKYDIEVAYLEGPSARVISGCPDEKTKKLCWIHSTMNSKKQIASGFLGADEAQRCYGKMDAMVFVSESVRNAFLSHCPYDGKSYVLYNTNESAKILADAADCQTDLDDASEQLRWCGVGKLVSIKGFDRMIRIQARLKAEGIYSHLYILGEGPMRAELESLAEKCGVLDSLTFLGYQTNPYKYVSKCDLFVCASHAEGFSTAATEALIVGTPVCTVEVSGMKEMLGENNEWGIVTENSEEALYQGIKRLLSDPELLAYYKEKATQRGQCFSTENTVRAVEEMLLDLRGRNGN